MKLTLKQRLKILFTGKMPEPPTAPTAPTTPPAPPAPPLPTKLTHDDYVILAKKCRQTPNKWVQITIKPRNSARPLASKIKNGNILAFKKPRGGRYDTHAIQYLDEYIVEAKFIPNNKKGQTK